MTGEAAAAAAGSYPISPNNTLKKREVQSFPSQLWYEGMTDHCSQLLPLAFFSHSRGRLVAAILSIMLCCGWLKMSDPVPRRQCFVDEGIVQETLPDEKENIKGRQKSLWSCTVNISKYSTHKNKWIAMKSKGWQTNIKKWLKSWPLQREYQSIFFIAKETLKND